MMGKALWDIQTPWKNYIVKGMLNTVVEYGVHWQSC